MGIPLSETISQCRKGFSRDAPIPGKDLTCEPGEPGFWISSPPFNMSSRYAAASITSVLTGSNLYQILIVPKYRYCGALSIFASYSDPLGEERIKKSRCMKKK